jgi:hypothetical protein
MKLVKYYECETQPTDEEINVGMNIVAKEDCIVNLKWFHPNSGWYTIRIEKDTTFEKCKLQIPKYYAV